jgi:hypothetical protein
MYGCPLTNRSTVGSNPAGRSPETRDGSFRQSIPAVAKGEKIGKLQGLPCYFTAKATMATMSAATATRTYHFCQRTFSD